MAIAAIAARFPLFGGLPRLDFDGDGVRAPASVEHVGGDGAKSRTAADKLGERLTHVPRHRVEADHLIVAFFATAASTAN